jgi:hypothetical protein
MIGTAWRVSLSTPRSTALSATPLAWDSSAYARGACVDMHSLTCSYPGIRSSNYLFNVMGHVDRPLELTLDEQRAIPKFELVRARSSLPVRHKFARPPSPLGQRAVLQRPPRHWGVHLRECSPSARTTRGPDLRQIHLRPEVQRDSRCPRRDARYRAQHAEVQSGALTTNVGPSSTTCSAPLSLS